ncbi:MAG: type I-G CRISPR-associated RAMP protein Csb1/Cas7g [Brooklawnia sp.]|jgi:CRISPR-associated protein Csb1
MLDLTTLIASCTAGGPSVLASVTELCPAAGEHAAIAPARYVSGRSAAYAFETRNIDGEPADAVLVDSKAAQLNRMEGAIALAIEEGDPALSRMPRMTVTYGREVWADYEAPHRAFDGHFRAGTVDGTPLTKTDEYRAMRNCTPANARPLLEQSPVSLAFGAWDSTRRSNQVRFRSAIVGEIIGVLVDQTGGGRDVPKRGGGRSDSISPSVKVSAKAMELLLEAQEDELSPKTVQEIRKSVKSAKQADLSGSVLGLGSIPPALSTLGLVACSRIIRSHVLSFSTLRQLRFGSPGEGDVAARALVAALALYSLTLSNQELLLRANCDLVEAGPPAFRLDGRHGTSRDLGTLTPETMQAVLLEAIEHAEATLGIRWEGQILAVEGNPIVAGGTEADPDEE